MTQTPHRARKRFGQHFLHDRSIVGRIVDAIGPRPGEHIVEIGPGLGALTVPLLERHGELDVVEIDRDVIPHLEQACAGKGTLRIHNVDALKFDFGSLAAGQRLRVVGNLPYNISTPLIFHLLEDAANIVDMHFLLQKEVVERLTAAPGTGDYGRLSVMVQYRCRAEYLFHVGPGAFSPPPRVDSAVVRLTPHEALPFPARDEQRLAELVNQAFSKRRKTLRNGVKGLLDAEGIERVGVDPSIRPERVTVEEFVRLANASLD